MKINHFQIGPRGDAALHWNGTPEEINYFKKWVENIVPKKLFFWYDRVGKPGEQFHDSNLSGNFHVQAWTVMCYFWTTVHAPALGQVWKEKQPNYPHKTQGHFAEKGTSLEQHDHAVLNLMRYEIEGRECRKEKTPEMREVLDFMLKKERELHKRIYGARKPC